MNDYRPLSPMRFASGEPITENDSEYFADPIPAQYRRSPIIQQSVRAKFLGVNSVYITDGRRSLLIDPFFTRPHVSGGTGPDLDAMIEPDADIISGTLQQAGITEVNAILMTHGHWDHALDLPEVWECLVSSNGGRTFPIYGTRSVGNIVARSEAASSHFNEVDIGSSIPIDNFRVIFLDGRHSRLSGRLQRGLGGPIEATVPHRARAGDYKEGEHTFSIMIQHSRYGSILHQGSANYIEGYYSSIFAQPGGTYARPDVLLLGIAGYNTVAFGMWGFPSSARRRDYFREVVEATDPARVLFTHWDKFGREECTLDHPVRWFYDSYQSRGIMHEFMRQAGGSRRISVRSGEHQVRTRTEYDIQIEYLPLWEEVLVLPAPRRQDTD